jgi:type IV secretory pathway TraG/TraD family ATPase VirD4
MNTCKEYSELCGNITVVTSSSSGSVNSNDINLSNQTQVRPLIYPSELQRLNKPGDIGNSIIVTFGNYPLKTYFSPSFKVPFYQTGKMDTNDLSERYFDENTVLYSVSKRNSIVFEEVSEKKEEKTKQGEGKEDAMPVDESSAEAVTDTQNEENVSSEPGTPDSDEQTLIAMWQAFKNANPEGTLPEFYGTFANMNQEG